MSAIKISDGFYVIDEEDEFDLSFPIGTTICRRNPDKIAKHFIRDEEGYTFLYDQENAPQKQDKLPLVSGNNGKYLKVKSDETGYEWDKIVKFYDIINSKKLNTFATLRSNHHIFFLYLHRVQPSVVHR